MTERQLHPAGTKPWEASCHNLINLLIMAKLQLYITKSTSDFKSVYNINPSEDVRSSVTDLRKAVSQIDYDSAEKNIFYFLKSTNEGTFVTVLRTIPSRPGDHLAAWIYMSADMSVSADELESIVRLTTRKVSGSEVSTEDVAALREAFSADYPTRHDAPALTGGRRGGGFAWRRYGGDEAPSLHEMLGRGLWQQYYLPYEGVLLVDEELGIMASGDDLTDRPLGAEAVVLPPESTEDGFKPYIFGRLLDRPMRATMGCELTVVWRRPGFEDVTRTAAITEPVFTPSPVVTDDSRKTITPNSFKITSQFSHQPVSDCQIRINGYEITPEGRSFTRAELLSASVVVSCEGYFPYSGHIDLASTTKALIQLQERRKIYVFEVPVKSSDLGAPVKFEIHSKKPLTDSPLEGYRLLDEIQEGINRTNYLGYSGSGLGSMTRRIIIFGAVLIVGLIAGLTIGRCSRTSSPALSATNASAGSDSTQTTPAENTASEVAVPAATAPETRPASDASQAKVNPALTMTDAIKYLDASGKWNRDEMEKYSDLRGLYDDMNNFRIDRLINTWGPKLNGSKNFARVTDHAQKGQSPAKKSKLKISGTYNKADDNTITLQSYLNRIDP